MDLQYDVIIIGAGPAGMTAAVYASRAGLKTAMLEKAAPGGKMIKTFEIQNWPGIKEINGADLAYQMFEHSTHFGAEYLYGDVEKIIDGPIKQVVCADGQIYTAPAVIIATGTRERLLGIPNEKELTGKGVSYCAVCDGSFFRDQPVTVIGGGNSALEESLYLTQFASEVHIVIRRDVFRAEPIIQQAIEQNPKIDIIRSHVPVEILEQEAVFPYIGADPCTEFAQDLGILDEHGYILVNNNMETTRAGIYGVGDVTAKTLRQVVTAANDGAIAAQQAFHQIKQ